MRLLRYSFLSKFLAVFMLLVVLESTIHATVSFALTSPGPHQPEYMSYEEAGSPDMVNLLTGDFTFNIPVLEVPGPEGDFSVPLTYNGGIGAEQEASWVGLGFNLNVGAITRVINQYPDDASGMSQNVNVKSPGVRGWTASILTFGNIGWNTSKGYNGSFSIAGMLNLEYDGSSTDFNLKGIQSFDGVLFASQLLSVVSLANNPIKFAKQTAWSIGVNALIPSQFSLGSVSSSSSIGHYEYNTQTRAGFLNLYQDYWTWLDKTRTEFMYGILNFDRSGEILQAVEDTALPTSVNGSAAQKTKGFYNGKLNRLVNGSYQDVDFGTTMDVNYYMPPGKEYTKVSSSALLAIDDYSVNAPGISGSIEPSRLDVGSLAIARNMYASQIRYNALPYTSYKVPFVYTNSIANSYLYPTGDVSSSNFGLSFTGGFPNSIGTFGINDPSFGSQRVRSDIQQVNYKIAQSNHIEYLSNLNIYNSTASFPNGFMDYFSGLDRQSFRFPYIREKIDIPGGVFAPSNSIGGYSITSSSGVTYHFALPVFEIENVSTITSISNPGNVSNISRTGPVAGTWLLTGITGPDFVDRNNNGAIDETDWGYWIKFNYGQLRNIHNSTLWYRWGTSDGSGTIDPTGTVTTDVSGARQCYYLNSIETRTHVAVFLKDVRQDNKSYNATSSLCLKEIVLLKREAYKQLIDVYGFANDSGSIANWWRFNSFYPASGNTAAGNFVVQQALKRIQFIQSYDLCGGTTNSIAPNQGKLTLTKLKIVGKNGVSALPDYKFEYGLDPFFAINYSNNPSYGKFKWDGWGMYNSSGSSDYRSHKASTLETDGTAWSLNRVITPMGSNIEIRYERDDYSKISGSPIMSNQIFSSYSFRPSATPYSGTSTLDISSPSNTLAAGDKVKIVGTASYSCMNNQSANYQFSCDECAIATISGNTITLSSSIATNNTSCPTSSGINYNCTITKIETRKKGGNIRVSSIITREDDKSYKTIYQYRLDNGNSSGVVSQEPGYENISSFDYNEIPNYPITPVMYSKVSVLTGRLNTEADYHTKTTYDFETPNLNLIVENPDKIQFNGTPTNSAAWLLSVKRNIFNHMAKLGNLNRVTTYDRSGVIAKQSTLNYTNSIVNEQGASSQGYYSSSTLMHDRVYVPSSSGVIGGTTVKMTRTSEVKVPYVLKSVNTLFPDGFTTIRTNLMWDFTSGQVLEKTEKSPLGLQTRTVIKPAFRVPEYSQMGSKAIDIGNKNMLGQEAATYVYKTDNAGNNLGLLSASVQTWKSDWLNYRYESGGNYVEGSESSPDVWRKYQNHVYKGAYSDLRPDGSLNFSSAKEFNFTSGAANNGWQKTGEMTRYDHYSAALEGKDLNGIFSSSKKDITSQRVFANASNANYFEFAYSGAEDWLASGSGLYLGGEVAKGSGNPVYKTTNGSETHTGAVALQLTNGSKGFIYKPSSLSAGRTYRVSSWTNSPNGAIYYKLNNGAEQTILPSASLPPVGGWHQINAQIPVSSFASLEVGVKSNNGTVSFDDFRFQPLDGAVTANVYDPSTGNVTFTLDNQNMFTQYEYNDRGQLVKTYSESFKYKVKLISENKQNLRRFTTN